MEWRLSRGIIHTFPSAHDEDQNPYVFDVRGNTAGQLAVAACGPGHLIKVYDKASLACVQQLAGHTARVNEVRFGTDPNCLYTASADSSVKIWDIRQPAPVHSFTAGSREFCSADMNITGTVLAAGWGAATRVYDLRTMKLMRSYVDAHTEDVTQARFHPALSSVLVTGSVDGLVCVCDNDNPSLDDSLIAVLSVEVSVNKVGFTGTNANQVYVLTSVEGIQLWDFGGERRLVRIDDLRPSLSAASPGLGVDYCIDCKYHTASDTLYVLGGSDEGHVGIYLLKDEGPTCVGTLSNPQGHTEVVRGFDWDVGAGVLFTGGEDCKVCCWQAAAVGQDIYSDRPAASVQAEGPGKHMPAVADKGPPQEASSGPSLAKLAALAEASSRLRNVDDDGPGEEGIVGGDKSAWTQWKGPSMGTPFCVVYKEDSDADEGTESREEGMQEMSVDDEEDARKRAGSDDDGDGETMVAGVGEEEVVGSYEGSERDSMGDDDDDDDDDERRAHKIRAEHMHVARRISSVEGRPTKGKKRRKHQWVKVFRRWGRAGLALICSRIWGGRFSWPCVATVIRSTKN